MLIRLNIHHPKGSFRANIVDHIKDILITVGESALGSAEVNFRDLAMQPPNWQRASSSRVARDPSWADYADLRLFICCIHLNNCIIALISKLKWKFKF